MIIIFTIVSAGLGVGLSLLIKPGIGVSLAGAADVAKQSVESTSLQETILNFVPTNVIQAMSEGSMVPCIVFALFFGVAMGAYARESGNKVVVDWIVGLNGTITNIIKIVMNVAPIGIFCCWQTWPVRPVSRLSCRC